MLFAGALASCEREDEKADRMRNSSGVLAYLGIAVVVIIGGLLAGYYYKGATSQPAQPAQTAAQTAQPAQPAAAPTPTPAPKHQVASASDYTSPDAPSIDITEVKGAPIPRKTTTDNSSPAATTPSTPTDTDSAGVANPNNGDNSAQPADTGSATPGTDTSTPADNNPSDTVTGDNTAGAGDQAADNAAPPGSQTGALYRVQAGSFINEANARILASALRRRGYSAVAVPGTEDGKPVFKVQVGAYRNKALAEQAATDLQKTGYPAYVSGK